MKNACIAMIKAQRPVFFGSDVGKFSDRSSGIMDTQLYDYELGFNLALKMDKAQRLLTKESQMTHAMVLTGVHIVDGKPVKWRGSYLFFVIVIFMLNVISLVENSWGTEVGKDGYFVMADRWMDEYCYQAVVDPSFVSKEIRAVLKQDPVVLPLWDPMGALA
jgi:bleomycin hydrolase